MTFNDKTYPIYFDFDDVLIEPRILEDETYLSRNQVDVTTRLDYFSNKVPIIAANMETVGTFAVANVLSKYSLLTFLHKFYKLEDYDKHFDENLFKYVGASVGMRNNDNFFEVMEKYAPYIKYINADVANGYIASFGKFVTNLRKKFPNHVIIAGNVATPQGVRFLADCGADVVKVGIGPGSACMTRHMTGAGVPQLSAVMMCSDVNVPIIADGGIKFPGDIVKAFVGGASAVMVGSLFAGVRETGTVLYGMSSHYAQKKFNMYGNYKASEGKYIDNYKNPLGETLDEVCQQILGGLKSGISYCGETQLDNIIRMRNFVISKSSIYNNFFNK